MYVSYSPCLYIKCLHSPDQNAFAKKLQPLGLQPFVVLAVDFLHEFELGVWNAVFQHLMRILHAAAPNSEKVAELDRRYSLYHAQHPLRIPLTTHIDRYQLVPSFGRSTIRRFSGNASEMKKLAARNYEDLL